MSLFRGRHVRGMGLGLGWPSGTYPSPPEIPKNSQLAVSSSGVLVTEQTSLALSAVSACVSLISDSVSALPLDVYRKRGTIREEVSPAPALITDPFGDGNPQDGLYQAVFSLLMRGNWYSFKRYANRVGVTGAGGVIGLSLPIHPQRVTPRIENGELLYRIDNKTDYAAREILHVKAFTIPGMLVGLGPLDYARETIGLGLAQQQYGTRFFGKDATPPFVILADADMNQDEIDELIDNWNKHHQGNPHEPGMLSGGATIKELAVTPEQAQFLEARKFQVAEVARLFRVPPHMIGDVERSTSWGTGIEQQGIGFTTYTLGSWTTRIERAFSVLLPSPQYVKFNLAALLRADTLTRYQAYEHARNAGLFNIDEIRELEEKPPLPDGKGQDHLQPLNYAPAGSESASGGKGATNGQ